MNYYGGNNDNNNESSQQQQQQEQQPQLQLQQQIARQQLESSLNEDISRIIQLQQEAPLSAPSSQAPISAATSDIASSESQQHSASTIPVTDISQSIKQQVGLVNSQKELKKFDYDIIQSSSSPNLMHLNELSGEINSNQQHQQQMLQQAQKPTQQIQTQIDFVPQQQQQHQQQQQSSSARQVTPASHLLVASTEQLISQQQQNKQVFNRQQLHRDRLNGQVIKASPSSNGQKPADQDGAVAGRVPIYRSLFKTLKGGQGRLHAATGATNQNGNRYSISRRRRERNQQSANQQIQSSTTSTIVGGGSEIPRINQQQQQQQIWTSVAPSIMSSPSAISTAPETSSSPAATPQVNSTHQQNVPPSLHRTHHGVASYLQLLNSRYNLRLNRVSSQPTMMVA